MDGSSFPERQWRVCDWGVKRDDGSCQFLSILDSGADVLGNALPWMVARVGNEYWGDRELANAQILAAAPELLQMAIECRAVLRTALAEAEPDTPKARVLAAKIAKLSAVIAKAAGETV